MAMFTWKAGRSADWAYGRGLEWERAPRPLEAAAPRQTSRRYGNSPTGLGQLTVSVATKETFDFAPVNIGDSGVHQAPALSITGTVLTDTLHYTTPAGQSATAITLNAGGILDIRTCLTTTSSVAETLIIATE